MQPAIHRAVEAAQSHLGRHDREPHEARGDVQAVAADEREEGREERAGLRRLGL